MDAFKGKYEDRLAHCLRQPPELGADPLSKLMFLIYRDKLGPQLFRFLEKAFASQLKLSHLRIPRGRDRTAVFSAFSRPLDFLFDQGRSPFLCHGFSLSRAG